MDGSAGVGLCLSVLFKHAEPVAQAALGVLAHTMLGLIWSQHMWLAGQGQTSWVLDCTLQLISVMFGRMRPFLLHLHISCEGKGVGIKVVWLCCMHCAADVLPSTCPVDIQ
jgi:hypothetical protein